jgi:hypothetical protein
VRETDVERSNRIEELDVRGSKGDLQCLKIRDQVLNLPASNDGEDILGLVHHICDSNYEGYSATFHA